MELGYYYQKVNIQLAAQVTEQRLKILWNEILWNFKKIPEMLGFDAKYSAGQPKGKFWQLC